MKIHSLIFLLLGLITFPAFSLELSALKHYRTVSFPGDGEPKALDLLVLGEMHLSSETSLGGAASLRTLVSASQGEKDSEIVAAIRKAAGDRKIVFLFEGAGYTNSKREEILARATKVRFPTLNELTQAKAGFEVRGWDNMVLNTYMQILRDEMTVALHKLLPKASKDKEAALQAELLLAQFEMVAVEFRNFMGILNVERALKSEPKPLVVMITGASHVLSPNFSKELNTRALNSAVLVSHLADAAYAASHQSSSSLLPDGKDPTYVAKLQTARADFIESRVLPELNLIMSEDLSNMNIDVDVQDLKDRSREALDYFVRHNLISTKVEAK